MKAIQTANNKGGKLGSVLGFQNNNYIKLLSNINRTGLFSAFTFLLLALTCLFPISKGEQNTEAVTGTAQSSSLTLNVSSAAASVEFDVNSTDGIFASSSSANSAAFSVVTNNFSGYTLSISGSDNDGKLYDTTKKYFLEPLTSAVSEADFSSTSSLNGKWGYKPSKFNSAVNNNYLPAPTTTASTLDTTSVANPTANNYTISLGLRAGYDTVANTYANAFVITAVPNPITYVITYDANTTDTVSNMPASQNSTTSATEITLSDKTPARADYDFKGWCTTAPTTTNPDACTGTTYQSGDAYGIDQTVENITTLYAIWEEQIAGYIQDYTYARCSNEAASKAVKLMDKRDNKVYTARYINGLCTMTQNLKIDKGQLLTPADTNINSSYTMTSTDLTVGDNSYTVAEIHEGTGDQGNWYNYCSATAEEICDSSNTSATQDICPKGWRLPTLAEQTSITGTSQNSYSTTNVATFNAVAAGYYYSGSLHSSGSSGNWWSSTANGTALRFSLRYYTSNGLYSGSNSNLYFGYSVRCAKAKPGVTISFNANGGVGTMNMQKIDAGQSANLTANTFTRTDYVFTGWNTEPDGTGTSYANAAIYTVPTSEDNKIVVLYAQWVPAMQSFTSSQCQSQATDAAITLGDIRDGKTYTVRYIDDHCWMIQNLNFNMTSGMTLSPDTTNVATSSTITTVGSLTSGDSTAEPRTFVSSNNSYGTYYNFCAATAGELCDYTGTFISATQDICPKGWKMSGSSAVLSDIAAFSPVAAGSYSGGVLYEVGEAGYWWGGSVIKGLTEYVRYDSGTNYLSGLMGGLGDGGFSVRCVLK